MPILGGQDPQAVALAARALADGQLVAFPTETVYGLGARADDDAAVGAIFRLKGRPADHPLIVHVADIAEAESFAAEVPVMARALMQACWPGPVTVVLRRRPATADAAAAGQATIALRCPDHPVAQALLHEARRRSVPGVAAPSANRFGHVSPTRASHVADEFGAGLIVLDGGACREGIESTIVDCSGAQPTLLRPGTTPRQSIEAALGCALESPRGRVPRVPGSLASHYAPRAALRLAAGPDLDTRLAQALAAGVRARLGVYSRREPWSRGAAVWRRMPDDPRAAAHELFAVLRQFDADGVAQIWVERPPESPEWDGVRDRLTRACTPS